ncbi:beta-glucosidase [Macrophomina phaseolina]|uniref:Probable beta-glucosidase G n=1 Tax=Macrophomina phaseolina TaxID=35725 RepID=A0ABQ8GNT5_9PEZI|nr:beta-glucosidase [Macrophomina phaseolina]
MVHLYGPVYLLAALALGRMLAQEHFTTPDVFPSPSATGAGGWEDALDRAKEFVAQLNLTEKANIVTGTLRGSCAGNIVPIDQLNYTGLCMQDGPNAIRIADLASLFSQVGFALGEEFRDKGSHGLHGSVYPALMEPVAGPLGGRNWEGFSPDPYLTGVAMNETIRGTQDAGAQACAKHFVGNEQETQRSNTVLPDGTHAEATSSNIDDRTMHELYLWPFTEAVKAGVASVMCSYNRLNQTYACENPKLLNGLLKGELGFQDYVVSEWMATHSGITAAIAGLDMNMPGPIAPETDPFSTYFGANITAAAQNGSLPASRLDDMVARILSPYFLLHQKPGTYPSVDPTTYSVLEATYGLLQNTLGIPPARDVRRNHTQLIRAIAAAGTVLLKNVNGSLPLALPLKIGVFGNDAAPVSSGLAFRGTSAIRPRADAYGARVQYATDNELLAAGDFVSVYPVPDVCVVVAKAWAEESADRASLSLDWEADAVVEQVARRCNQTVVVTTLLPWAENANVTAVLAAHYLGEQSGSAIADVLFGGVEPKQDYGLPIVNLTEEDAADSGRWQADFEEGLFVDYRGFEKRGIAQLYEFGFGLGYTEWEIVAPLVVEWRRHGIGAFVAAASDPRGVREPGGDPELWEEVVRSKTTVRNTGSRAGSNVVRLYAEFPQSSVPEGTPKSVLRGFEKLLLQPGEEAEVPLVLLRRDVSFWNVTAQGWQIPAGEMILRVGSVRRT